MKFEKWLVTHMPSELDYTKILITKTPKQAKAYKIVKFYSPLEDDYIYDLICVNSHDNPMDVSTSISLDELLDTVSRLNYKVFVYDDVEDLKEHLRLIRQQVTLNNLKKKK